MKRAAIWFTLLTALAIMLPVAGAAATESETAVARLDAEGTLAHDIALRAQGKGWTIGEAEAEYAVGEALDVVTSALAGQRPDVSITAARSDTPGGTPSLYIKGPADLLVRGLVDASPIKIKLVDEQPYSFPELLERRDRVVAALLAMGFKDFGVGSNLTGAGVIPVSVLAQSDAPASAADIVSNIPADLRSSIELRFADLPGLDTTSFGGMLVKIGTGNLATSGWSVVQSGTGVTGVTTAGHADNGANGLVHPGDATHNFIYQAEHRGTYGDV